LILQDSHWQANATTVMMANWKGTLKSMKFLGDETKSTSDEHLSMGRRDGALTMPTGQAHIVAGHAATR